MRCSECGHSNPDGMVGCPVCHGRPVSAPNSRFAGLPVVTDHSAADGDLTKAEGWVIPIPQISPLTGMHPDPQQIPFAPSSFEARAAYLAVAPQELISTLGDLTGRVIIAEPLYMERPDLDICKVLTKSLWLLLAVAAPFLLLHFVLVTLGALSAILAFIGLLFLLRFFSPTNLFSLFYLGTMLNPLGRREAEQTPVRHFRVRADDRTEVAVRMKGDLDKGNIGQDDVVSFWGHWRGGILEAKRGYNHRTRSWVELRPSYSWLYLLVTLVIVGVLAGYFYEPFRAMVSKINELGALR